MNEENAKEKRQSQQWQWCDINNDWCGADGHAATTPTGKGEQSKDTKKQVK